MWNCFEDKSYNGTITNTGHCPSSAYDSDIVNGNQQQCCPQSAVFQNQTITGTSNIGVWDFIDIISNPGPVTVSSSANVEWSADNHIFVQPGALVVQPGGRYKMILQPCIYCHSIK